jgi:hypothetical protein
MIELSLLTLLNTMAPRFCEYKSQGMDDTKSTLLAYSDMHEKYPPKAIREAVANGRGLKEIAVATVLLNCPGQVL